MPLKIIFIPLFVFLLLMALWGNINRKQSLRLTSIVLALVAFLIGIRPPGPDYGSYLDAFALQNNIFSYVPDIECGFAEPGLKIFAACCRLFTDSPYVYFTLYAAVCMGFLYYMLYTYSPYPFVGLMVYAARFLLNRDCVQMRSSLAILLVVLSAFLFVRKQRILSFALFLLAYQFHHLAMLGLPFVLFFQVRWKTWQIVGGVVLAILASQFASGFIAGIVGGYAQDLEYGTYVQDQYVSEAQGLANPLIYWQILLLLLYTYRIWIYHPDVGSNRIVLSGYFYSTLILIALGSNYTTLAGRTSTVYATLEILLIPQLLNSYKGNDRNLCALLILVMYSYFFYTKFFY